jgi:RimJ/RimL family protein N-acetyltransferase
VSSVAWLRAPLPERIATPRLVLRRWQLADAERLKDAIDASLPELQAWMAWALDEPSPIDVLERRLQRFRDEFGAAGDWIYGIFDDAERRVIGGTGLHVRGGPDVREIGYWIRTDATHQGYATEAAGILTDVAFELTAVAHVEIRCDPNNRRSAAVPRRLGYRHTETRRGDARTPAGEPRDTMVWTLTAAEHAALAAHG